MDGSGCAGWSEPSLAQGFLDALRGGCSDALVNRESLPQVPVPFAGITVLEVGSAEPFVGVRLLEGAPMSRDGERVSVVAAGLAGFGGSGGQLAEVVQCIGEPTAITCVTA